MMMLMMFEKRWHASRNPRQSAIQRLAHLSSPCIAARAAIERSARPPPGCLRLASSPASPSPSPACHSIASSRTRKVERLATQPPRVQSMVVRSSPTFGRNVKQRLTVGSGCANLCNEKVRGAMARMSRCVSIVLQGLFNALWSESKWVSLTVRCCAKTHTRRHLRCHAANASQAQRRSRVKPYRSSASSPSKTPSGAESGVSKEKASVLETS